MRHVLFVDDEPAVLSGIRRMLHPMRTQWDMAFAADGESALEALAARPADVVVADMRMPGLDGAALLTEIRRQWPETVRIILSGFADQGAALRSVPVAHQFLSKPCDPAILSTTLTSACDLHARLSRPELRRLVGGIGALPSAPRSFHAITESLGRPDVCPEKVASIIEEDPGCSAKLLQLVNSAFFGLARTVTRVQDAVAYLGLSKVRDVVLAAEATSMFQCDTPELAQLVQQVNEHCLSVARTAREVAPPHCSHDAFIAGILHDVGMLALAATAPERYLPIWRAWGPDDDFAAMERAALGASHADVGAYLLRLWGLPFPLVETVARHCDPDAVTDANPVVAAVAGAAASAGGDEHGSRCGRGGGGA